MKNRTLLFVVSFFFSVSLFFFASCNNKTQNEEEASFGPMFTADDTLMVVSMCETWLDRVKENKLDSAFSILNNLKDGDLSKLSVEEKEVLTNQFTAFPVLSYKLVNMTWRNTYDVKLTYSFEFMEVEEGSGIPNTMTLTFAPQRRNKIWFLAIEK